MRLSREMVMVLVLTVFASASVWAADNPKGYYTTKYENNFEQDVEGEGYVAGCRGRENPGL